MRQIRPFHLIDPTFHGQRSAYFLQAAPAAISLVLILVVEVGVSSVPINTSIASSVFLVFVVPHSLASSTRRLLGGHIVGVISGDTCAVAGAIGVGVAILVMAITNTAHPPAAGTTLGLITVGADTSAVLFILSAAAILTAIHLLLARYMANLLEQ